MPTIIPLENSSKRQRCLLLQYEHGEKPITITILYLKDYEEEVCP